jgi:hypothetical protein
MHMAFIYIFIQQTLVKVYITKPEATTSRLQTRQWVKKHVVGALCPENRNNTPAGHH